MKIRKKLKRYVLPKAVQNLLSLGIGELELCFLGNITRADAWPRSVQVENMGTANKNRLESEQNMPDIGKRREIFRLERRGEY